MLNYDAASRYANMLLTEYETTYYSWDRTPVVTMRNRSGMWDQAEAVTYRMLASMYVRQHDFDQSLLDYVVEYLRMSIPLRDALMLGVSVFVSTDGAPMTWDMGVDAFELGLAEMLDSYLAGVKLEHILG